MKRFLLDTNICIAYLKASDPKLIERLVQHLPEDFVLCSVVKAELEFGAYKSQHRFINEQKLEIFFSQFDSYPFNDEPAKIYGGLRYTLEKLGKPIGPNDLMIASIALQNDLTLVTRNISEFERVPNLKIEGW